jgi:hypothetical protein
MADKCSYKEVFKCEHVDSHNRCHSTGDNCPAIKPNVKNPDVSKSELNGLLARLLCEQYYRGFFSTKRITKTVEARDTKIAKIVDEVYPMWLDEANEIIEKIKSC